MISSIKDFDLIAVILCTVIIVICSVAIVISIKFQNKQKKKYKECLNLIKEKENGTLNIKNGLDNDEIKKIDKSIDINKLMMKLYDIYVEFVEKINKNDSSLDNVLDGFIKEFYKNKIEIYIGKNCNEIVDNIELINYSILEYSKEKTKFRINITCSNYKKMGDKIVSGSNYDRVEQIFIITYVNENKKWLINNVEKVYEKKLSI